MKRSNNKWTAERLAECRALYESGTPNQALGAMFGIKPATVAVMAWQRDWQRHQRLRQTQSDRAERRQDERPACQAEDINPPIPPTREETAFNARLARTIAAYWTAQGRSMELQIETMGSGIQCVRSRSINGVPTE